MKTKFLAAIVIACAGLFAGLFSSIAAPASADCAPGFTSIPCTIAQNVSTAPATTIGSLSQAPGQFIGGDCAQPTGGNPSGNPSTCGIRSITQLNGTGCAAGSADPVTGNVPSGEPCGFAAVQGQFSDFLTGLPGSFAAGANQIATAPQTIAGSLLAAPGQLINSLQNGGSYTPPAPDTSSTPSG